MVDNSFPGVYQEGSSVVRVASSCRHNAFVGLTHSDMMAFPTNPRKRNCWRLGALNSQVDLKRNGLSLVQIRALLTSPIG